MAGPVLELNLEKFYPEFKLQLELVIEDGEFFSLLGPSGCGKTTLLRLIAGLERTDRGYINLNGKEITDFPPAKRRIGLVFQNYALFPHLNVTQNIEYGLKIQRYSKERRGQRVGELLELFGLEALAQRPVLQLSGGEQQRVAIARALAPQPAILLLDEPFSALDYGIRNRLRTELKQLQKKLGFTTIFVTHQQEEALSISDRIGLMREGRLLQTGTPREVYQNPANRFVAEFLGDANLIPCRDGTAATGDFLTIMANGGLLTLTPEAQAGEGWLMVRPEDIRLNPVNPMFEGRVTNIEYLGPFYRMEIETGYFKVKVIAGKEAGDLKEGSRVGFSLAMEMVKVIGE